MACGSYYLPFRSYYYNNLLTGVWGWGWMGMGVGSGGGEWGGGSREGMREHASSAHKAKPIAKYFPLAKNIYWLGVLFYH